MIEVVAYLYKTETTNRLINVQFKYRLFKVFGEHGCCLDASVVFVPHFH